MVWSCVRHQRSGDDFQTLLDTDLELNTHPQNLIFHLHNKNLMRINLQCI